MTTPLGNANNLISSPTPSLLTKEIQDLFVRKNFQNLVAFFAAQNQMINFSFFELIITAATTLTQSMNHNLGYLPKDVVVTQTTGAGTVTFLYGQFTSTQFFYTATGACRVRFFIGTYFNDTSTVTANSTDAQTVVPTPLTASQSAPIAVTGSYQMLGTEYVVRATTTGIGAGFGALITLPVGTKGMIARVQKVDNNSHPVSILVAGSQQAAQIVPPAARSLQITTQWVCYEMIFDGTNWCVYNKWSGS